MLKGEGVICTRKKRTAGGGEVVGSVIKKGRDSVGKGVLRITCSRGGPAASNEIKPILPECVESIGENASEKRGELR